MNRHPYRKRSADQPVLESVRRLQACRMHASPHISVSSARIRIPTEVPISSVADSALHVRDVRLVLKPGMAEPAVVLAIRSIPHIEVPWTEGLCACTYPIRLMTIRQALPQPAYTHSTRQDDMAPNKTLLADRLQENDRVLATFTVLKGVRNAQVLANTGVDVSRPYSRD